MSNSPHEAAPTHGLSLKSRDVVSSTQELLRGPERSQPSSATNGGEVPPSMGNVQPPCFSLTAVPCIMVWSEPQQEMWHRSDSRAPRSRGWAKNCKTLHQTFFFFFETGLSKNKKRMCSLWSHGRPRWFPLHGSDLLFIYSVWRAKRLHHSAACRDPVLINWSALVLPH